MSLDQPNHRKKKEKGEEEERRRMTNPVFNLSVEAKLVGRCSCRHLVGSKPLISGHGESRKESLDIINVFFFPSAMQRSMRWNAREGKGKGEKHENGANH